MIAIIGGSGLEDPSLLKDSKEIVIQTPFGAHSPIKKGIINGIELIIMSRHGYKHELSPSMINYRANIFVLKELNVKTIIATSACGSLKEELAPETISFPNQFIDMTKKRETSFTEKGKIIHEGMGEPFNKKLREILTKKATILGYEHSAETTLITIEGPRFSSKAESELFRKWDADLINMTTVPEVCLAKELKIPYQVINLITDYDCWKEGEEEVTFEIVMERMKKNAEKVKKLIIESLKEINEEF
jgi:5'-methylthioadenosine phosphorylase